MMTIISWSWAYMAIYIAAMLFFAFKGKRAISNADEFATARSSYGPIWLAVAFAATAASGATFIGLPALAYERGISVMWLAMLYPIGLYVGVAICQKMISRVGNDRGNRSIPEYLGDRYQSDALRLIAAIFSLILLFYLAGQLIAGLVMFEMMLGLSKLTALLFTSLVLTFYVVMGGAHADILSDGLQGFLMLIIAMLVGVMFFVGFGVVGGFEGMMSTLKDLDPRLVQSQPKDYQLVSTWSLIAVLICHIPLGLLPHVANKLWALKSPKDQKKFITIAFVLGMIFPIVTIGGVLGRAVLGDALLENAGTANSVIPMLFIELFPPYIAAALGVTILAAVMSTADGLVISTTQVFSNDIYRRSILPRLKNVDETKIAKFELGVNRWASALIMVGATILAWNTLDKNVTLLIWTGIGGMVAALAGPLVLGSLWMGVTRLGALWGFISGAVIFIMLKSGSTPTFLPQSEWLIAQAPNPYSCSAIGIIAATLITVVVSLLTKPLPEEHISSLMGKPS